jgi:hypothetical protein
VISAASSAQEYKLAVKRRAAAKNNFFIIFKFVFLRY